MESRQTLPYSRKDPIYPSSHQTLPNPPTYYPITDQLQYVQSRIVTQNNSSLVSAINLNPNKLSAYQRSLQFDSEHNRVAVQVNGFKEQHNYNHQANHQHMTNNNNNNSQPTHKLSRPGSNKIAVTNDNSSLVGSQQRNQQSSLSKRPGSVTRGGIKVVSRNSSLERKSETSVQKSITSKDLNTHHGNHSKTPTSIALCGLNCTTRNPFTQNQQSHQMTVVPNLGSLQTLKSGITSSHLPYSQRQHLHSHPSRQTLNNNKNFYDNISQRNHIQPSPQHYLPKNHSQLMKENLSSNINNLQKVYKQVREMMEKEIQVAKKMYEKKYLDEVQCLNGCYKTQIQTLQRVLGENLTVIQEQAAKINKLQDRLYKKQAKAEKYSQRFQALTKFIQSSSKFSLQRIDQVQHKFILLLTEFQSSHLTPNPNTALQNKLSYLQSIFSTVISKTIIKYRSIQYQIKEQVKNMMKKYDYYQQKIYEMDLMKHLGKENQIQNYRLIETIEGIKEKLVILEGKASMRSEIRELNAGITIGNEGVAISSDMKNAHRVDELRRVIPTMEYKLGNLQQEATQTSIKMYKLQSTKTQLQNKVSALENQLITTQNQLFQIKTQRDSLLIEKQKYQAQRYQAQRQNHQQPIPNQSPQKCYTNPYNFDLSSQKKSQQHGETQNSQAQAKQMRNQVQRLQEIIEQYEAKIQQLHDAINNLQKQNSALISALNNKTKNEQQQKQLILTQTKLNQQKEQKQQSTNQSAIIQKLNQQLNAQSQQLQQVQFSLQQVTRQKQQLQQALQATDNIFDQQISKFKQTIRVLQQQNSQLLAQIYQLRQAQQLGDSSSSFTKSNIQKVTLAKSPKKEMCETVTMNWFKKNISNQQAESNTNEGSNSSYQQNSLNSNNNSKKSFPSNPKNNLSSPINQYYAQTNYKLQNRTHHYQYTDEIKQHSSSNTIHQQQSPQYEHMNQFCQQQSPQQKDQFFYPQSMNNPNLSSRRSIDSTSIMQSHTNIIPYCPKQINNNYINQSNLYQGKSTKPANSNKLETQRIAKRYQTSSYGNNRYEQYGGQGSEENCQDEETEAYIF